MVFFQESSERTFCWTFLLYQKKPYLSRALILSNYIAAFLITANAAGSPKAKPM